ncbi:PREDICTED: glucose-6-phosphate exchanger SLC37A2-like isoform X1 [Branchiostoma belcheri]|uniref:Sugar phosphate exchanger 3 n=1 Tax=Branchiostoma belcheri TaxID=7741 RepID=A0A6P4Y8Y9_BRABE|nr:PREDICTED: glucose-6-phosphate exchanger SLC37A2-like isoform X1 [Branchiostoma belcheri]
MAVRGPPGIRFLQWLGLTPCWDRQKVYQLWTLFLTFLCYTSYHLSRKPISIVKNELHKNCNTTQNNTNTANCSSWKPFDGSDYESLFGDLDTAFLFAYAGGMFFSGHIAERSNLRYFLVLGMLSSGLMTALFGLGYYWNIHTVAFFVIVQAVAGVVQATGWPAVVTCVGSWFGKGRRGFIMGLWNSHTSVGNILGSLIAAAFVSEAWGLSFVVPGIIIASVGILAFFFLITEPKEVGIVMEDKGRKDSYTVQADGPTQHIPLCERCFNEESETETTEVVPEVASLPVVVADSEPLLGEEIKPLSGGPSNPKAISFLGALKIPGVIEFSMCLFFAKLVSYTFLYWLPKYIKDEEDYSPTVSGDMSTLFDVGGIVGGFLAGTISDFTGGRATCCVVMLVLGAPMLYVTQVVFQTKPSTSTAIGMLAALGFLVNGPYALITTAVSADLGTHKSLKGNAKALSTVTAIIDGTGSIGAAVGPLLAGIILNKAGSEQRAAQWDNVFYMLMASDVLACLFLLRVFVKEIKGWCTGRCFEQETSNVT